MHYHLEHSEFLVLICLQLIRSDGTVFLKKHEFFFKLSENSLNLFKVLLLVVC